MVSKRILTRSQCAASLFIITSGAIFLIENAALISYWYTLLLFFLINRFLDPQYKYSNYFIFHFYLFIAVTIYCIQLYNIPDYMGMSGPPEIGGTDDVGYFETITDAPMTCSPRRQSFEISHFMLLLDFLYPFKIYIPLNVIILNLLGITFLPYFTSKLTFLLFQDSKVAKLAGLLLCFCPFVMLNGLIILRDVWTTTLVIASLYFFASKRYCIFLLLTILLGYIRFGTIIFLVLGLMVLLKERIYTLFVTNRQALLVSICIVVVSIIFFFCMLPLLLTFSDGKLETSLFRESFVDVLALQDEEATIVKLARLPILLRIPLLLLFFLFAPFFKPECYTDGIFNIRAIISGILSPIYLFFCWKYIIKSFFIGFFRKTTALPIIQIVFLCALALGTISLQIRHKTVLMPFLYMLVAYGYYLPKMKNDKLFLFIAGFIVIFECFYALR